MLLSIFLIVFLGTLHFTGTSAQCGIAMHPVSQNVLVGNVVNLQCLLAMDAVNNGTSVEDWLFERSGTTRSVVDNLPRDTYELNDGVLTINNFDPIYAGSYRCVVRNDTGRCVSKAAKLSYFATEDSAFKISPQDFVAFEGFGTAAFNCTYDDDDEYLIPPTIIWKLNETTLQNNSLNIAIFGYGHTSFLQLYEPTSSMHMANISCIAQIKSGKDVYSQAATLQIMSGNPPSDKQPSLSTMPIPFMYLNKGDTVIAGCSSNSINNLPIAWAYENKTEFYFAGFDFLLDATPLSLYGNTNLLVNSTGYDFHNVTYLCQLLWDGSFINAPVTFFVYDKPMISYGETSGDTEKGKQVVFSIEISKDTPAMVKWFFNGAPLSSSGDRRIEIDNEDNDEFNFRKLWIRDLDASLHINNATCDDTGFYQVEIGNPVETVLSTYWLNVDDCSNTTMNTTNTTMNTTNTTMNTTNTTMLPIEQNSNGSNTTMNTTNTTMNTTNTTMLPIEQNSNDDDSFPWWIILIIILLLLILLLLLLCCIWCWRRRYVVYEAEKLENKYHKEYEIIPRDGSPGDATL